MVLLIIVVIIVHQHRPLATHTCALHASQALSSLLCHAHLLTITHVHVCVRWILTIPMDARVLQTLARM